MATSFSPNRLRSTIADRGGLATTEKFEVVFSGNGIANLDSGIAKDLQFLCENVALPTKSISAQEKFIHGVAYQMPYRQAFQELSMTFLVVVAWTFCELSVTFCSRRWTFVELFVLLFPWL